jgi:outer membrane protein OmpA-like peptidoglycan-associated protein
MRSELVALVALAGCYKAQPEICEPVVTSWSAPTYECLAYKKDTAKPGRRTAVTQDRIVLKERVEFETDSAVLKDSSKPMLDEVADVMKDHPEIEHVRIAGHTDSSGSREHNQKLSEERAASVEQYLVRRGVAQGRLDSKGYGQDRPIADNHTEAGRAENRRVEIHILRRKGEAADRDPDAR